MQRLASPDLKVYTISDLEALSELVAGLRLDSTLASNLLDVLGLHTVGDGGRDGRQMAGNWPRLHIVSCALRRLKHALVPVVGSNAIRIFKRCCPASTDSRCAQT